MRFSYRPPLVSRVTLFACCALSTKFVSALAGASSVPNIRKDVINLQSPHVERSPVEALEYLVCQCRNLGIDAFDLYGDFEKTSTESYLKRFEQEVAEEFGKEDAVFMPSGGMAQSIALLIHSADTDKEERRSCFACHHTSHLLLHEQDAYRELVHMEPLVISTKEKAQNGISVPPMSFLDVQNTLDSASIKPHTLILELPHREIGGKLTSWSGILKIQTYCQNQGIKFHLDGARIFEATTGYPDIPLQDLASVFDSVYISFYKGLGGLAGAMLLGDKDFCDKARIWLRRFGGNLFTLLPYAVSGWAGYKQRWCLQSFTVESPSPSVKEHLLSFQKKKEKLVRIVEQLTSDDVVSRIVSFEPEVPETNMVHGYLKASVEACHNALNLVETENRIRVLVRVRQVEEAESAFEIGYRSRFEWAMGESNGNIPNDMFLKGWKALAQHLLSSDNKAKQ